MVVPPFPLSLLLLLLLSTTTSTEYLKLPLLHKTPLLSPSHILSLDLHRLSHHHHHHHHQTLKSPVISGAFTGSGQYFVNIRLGSPPQSLFLIADTGSDLLWVKCSPCTTNCSLNHPPGSAFLARLSSTFSPFHCFDSQCHLVPHPHPNPCNHSRLHSPCRYHYKYGDGSLSSGFFSNETTTLNTSIGTEHEHHISFGCGFSISGPSLTGDTFNGAHGVMGLGRGPISFSSQLGHRFGNKFSYCLMDYTLSPPPTSFLMIGGGGGSQNDDVFTKKMSFTPLLINTLAPTFYYIGIKNVFVNNVKLHIDPSVWSVDEFGNGGTIIDSGTTLSFLPEKAYRQIFTAFKERVELPSPAEPTQGFDLCVNVSGVLRPSLPKLSFELGGDSMFSPPSRNYFIETEDRVRCLAIQPVNSETGFSVLGNLMQQGFLFEFDRDRSRLGFSRHGCAI